MKKRLLALLLCLTMLAGNLAIAESVEQPEVTEVTENEETVIAVEVEEPAAEVEEPAEEKAEPEVPEQVEETKPETEEVKEEVEETGTEATEEPAEETVPEVTEEATEEAAPEVAEETEDAVDETEPVEEAEPVEEEPADEEAVEADEVEMDDAYLISNVAGATVDAKLVYYDSEGIHDATQTYDVYKMPEGITELDLNVDIAVDEAFEAQDLNSNVCLLILDNGNDVGINCDLEPVGNDYDESGIYQPENDGKYHYTGSVCLWLSDNEDGRCAEFEFGNNTLTVRLAEKVCGQ